MTSQIHSFFERLGLSPAAVLVTASVWALPALSPAFFGLQILAPLPAFYYLVELGRRRGSVTLFCALLLSGIITTVAGQSGAFVFTVLMLPAGLMLGRELLGKKSRPGLAGLKAMAAIMLLWLAWSTFYNFSGIGTGGLYKDVISNLDAGLVEVGETLKGNKGLDPEQALEIESTVARLRELLPTIMPGLLLTTMLNTIFFNMLAGQVLLRRKSAELVSWPPFSDWKLPEPLVALVILAGFCLLTPWPLAKDAGLNLLMVAGTLYFFQGLAILSSFLNRWSVPGLLRVLIYLLLLVQAYGVILLAIAGLADVWADLRRPRIVATNKDEN